AAAKVADDKALRLAVVDDQVEHLGVGVQGDVALAHLARQGLVGAEQQLLAGLAATVEGARYLGAAKGAVGKQSAVLARKRHALGHALIDNVQADLGKAINIGLARTEIAALERVVEETPNTVAVVLIVLGGVDAALGRDTVGPPRAVVKGEHLHGVAQ